RSSGGIKSCSNEYFTKNAMPRKSASPPIQANNFAPIKCSQLIGGLAGLARCGAFGVKSSCGIGGGSGVALDTAIAGIGGGGGFRSWLRRRHTRLRLHRRDRMQAQVPQLVFEGCHSPCEILNDSLCPVYFRQRDKRQNENRDNKTDYKKA